MEDSYGTYNKTEIRANIRKAIELAMWDNRNHPNYKERWDAIKDAESRLLEMFEIMDN